VQWRGAVTPVHCNQQPAFTSGMFSLLRDSPRDQLTLGDVIQQQQEDVEAYHRSTPGYTSTNAPRAHGARTKVVRSSANPLLEYTRIRPSPRLAAGAGGREDLDSRCSCMEVTSARGVEFMSVLPKCILQCPMDGPDRAGPKSVGSPGRSTVTGSRAVVSPAVNTSVPRASLSGELCGLWRGAREYTHIRETQPSQHKQGRYDIIGSEVAIVATKVTGNINVPACTNLFEIQLPVSLSKLEHGEWLWSAVDARWEIAARRSPFVANDGETVGTVVPWALANALHEALQRLHPTGTASDQGDTDSDTQQQRLWCCGSVLDGRGKTASAGHREIVWEPIRLAALTCVNRPSPEHRPITHIAVIWPERRAVELYRREDAMCLPATSR
jgi:hypothetical protein